MSLDYDKIKESQESASSKMASYSDLFMVLSFVFLLLYVVSSVRNGAFSVQKHGQFAELQSQADDLKQQIKVYNTLKEDHLAKRASEQEREVYKELMSRLTLLQDEAREEKDELKRQALENEKKEVALNKYQQVIRNIINANMLAKDRITRRDKVIVVKKETIEVQKIDIAQKKKVIEQKQKVIEHKQKVIEKKQQVIEEKDVVIAKNEVVIEKKSAKIVVLKKDVKQKKKVIRVNKREISSINKSLEKKIKDLKRSQQEHKISKNVLKKDIKKLRKISLRKIKKLNLKNKKVAMQLNMVNSELYDTNTQLDDARTVVSKQQMEKKRLASELRHASEDRTKMQQEHDSRMVAAKVKFDKNLKRQKLSARARAAKEAEFRRSSQAAESELKKKLVGLGSELSGLNKALKDQESAFASQMASEKAAFETGLNQQKLSSKLRARKMASFKAAAKRKEMELRDKIEAAKRRNVKIVAKNKKISSDLRKAQEIIDATKKLARQIRKNFKRAGIKADVDEKTGDVILSFGDDYFSTGKSKLKPSMKRSLQKFMPAYSASLFKDEKIAKKIESIGIVGFSSPTYKGKYIDPKSLAEKDRAAVSYNLNLSYYRARSIFSYIFNTREMRYKYQKRLLPLVKVTGRSFLAEGIQGRDIASGMSRKKYCQKFNCKKAQKVIIKFSLKKN